MAYDWAKHSEQLKELMPHTIGQGFLTTPEEGGMRRAKNTLHFDYKLLAREMIGTQSLLAAYTSAQSDIGGDSLQDKVKLALVKDIMKGKEVGVNVISAIRETSVTGFSFAAIAKAFNKKLGQIFEPEKSSAEVKERVTTQDILNARASLTGSSPVLEKIIPVFAQSILEVCRDKMSGEGILDKKINAMESMGAKFLNGKDSEDSRKAHGLSSIMELQMTSMHINRGIL